MEGHYKHIHKTPFDEKNNSGDDNDDDIKQIRPYDRLASRLGCDYCFFVTDYRQELDDHLNQKHPESRIDPRLIYTSKKVQDSRVTIKLEGISITPVHQTPKTLNLKPQTLNQNTWTLDPSPKNLTPKP